MIKHKSAHLASSTRLKPSLLALAPLNSINKTKKYRSLSKKAVTTAIVAALLASLVGCSDDDNSHGDGNSDSSTTPQFTPINLTIGHVNDTHSHLEPEGAQTFNVDGVTYRSERGGYARLKTVFDDLQSTYANENFIKLLAGDALTGTSYFSFYQGDADADMMNTICFDGFALGNHEFDEGDAGLKRFLDRLNGTEGNPNGCQTPVLAANVIPEVGTPLAPNNVDDYIKPYTIMTTAEGVKVGIIGIDIQGKTQNSSRPLESTEFLDEATTAQNYINDLKNQGIEHIVLLTHYTYGNDRVLAAELSGVDVIIGGDSHTLLGDFSDYTNEGTDSFGSQGPYPTEVTNKDGNAVCIGHAWEYTKAVGLMNIAFDENGVVSSCNGSQIIPIATTVTRYNDATKEFEAITETENQSVIDMLNSRRADLLTKDLILPYDQNTEAAATLSKYTAQIETQLQQVIGKADEPLCLVRVPGTTRAGDIAGCEDSGNAARGSDIAQVVAEAFLDGALRADFALQNSGGVRETVESGDVTYDTAYTILPFGNTLVNLDITGAQVKKTLEDAVANHLDNKGSSGSHPYAAGLRWDLDMSQVAGNRFSNIETRDRDTGVWSPLEMDTTYVMVTNDYIAEGRDGYLTLGDISADENKVENTQLLYTQSFIDYVEKQEHIARPPRSEYAHKNVITAGGIQLQ